ncbi:hypothetical protein RvY_09255 [Ramazzottius varieornatus]|uniref:Uncharacterized protein n=1 Tax=Ramazzottius varieornatus TaxID=947166 RepID=A0A1D1V8Q9_RAMVA|nr:hypothetical protein RvY_09255 [Ramazzottius varieornatus]
MDKHKLKWAFELDMFFLNTPFNHNLRAYDPTNNAGKIIAFYKLGGNDIQDEEDHHTHYTQRTSMMAAVYKSDHQQHIGFTSDVNLAIAPSSHKRRSALQGFIVNYATKHRKIPL